jgi:hypothetical protein
MFKFSCHKGNANKNASMIYLMHWRPFLNPTIYPYTTQQQQQKIPEILSVISSRNQTTINGGRNVGKKEPLHPVDGNIN